MDYDGRIREYPAIAIDRFAPQTGVKYYFLTHAHSDHTQGLQDTRFKDSIYCSELTSKLLMQKKVRGELYFGHLKNQFITHVFFEPFIVDTKEYGLLTITFIPSNHCPGAVMIMIEGKNGTILHTGDTRLERDYVNKYLTDLEHKKIKHLYLDTTFCTDQHREFITKNQSVKLLCDLIDSFPGTYHFYLDFWMYGYEQAWWHIAQKYLTQIHVSEERYQLYCHLNPEMFKSILTTDRSSTRFHSCQWKKNSSCFQTENHIITVQGIPIVGNAVRPWTTDEYILRSDLPKYAKVHQAMLFPFSMHSSLMELVDFVKLVKPKRVTPIVAHGRKWDTTVYMLTLLRSYGCRFGLDMTNSSSSSSSSVFSAEEQDNHEIKNDPLRSKCSYSTTTTDENSIPNSLSNHYHSENNDNNSVRSSLNGPTPPSSPTKDKEEQEQEQHPLCSIPGNNNNNHENEEEEEGFLEILSGPSEAALVSLGMTSLPEELKEAEPLTKYDRAAMSFRASILNRKRPHDSTAETLSWDGSNNFVTYSPPETEQHDPKRTLTSLNGAKTMTTTTTTTATTSSSPSSESKIITITTTTAITIDNRPTIPNTIKRDSKTSTIKVKTDIGEFGATIENPICLD